MAAGNPIVLMGTSQGVIRFEHDTVGPLSSDLESVSALSRASGGELVAGTDEGGLFLSRRRGVEWVEIARFPHAVASIVRLPGPRGELAVVDRAGGCWSGDCYGEAPFQLRCAGESTALVQAPSLARVPSTPNTLVLVDPCRKQLWRSTDGGKNYAPYGATLPGEARCITIHPGEDQYALIGLAKGLIQTRDGGQSYQSSAGPDQHPIQQIAFLRPSDDAVFLLCPPTGNPPAEGSADSPLWLGRRGLLRPVPSAVLDAPRDPTGVIQAVAWAQRNRDDVLLLGTDRGELLLLDPARQRCELLATGLPEIHVLLPGAAGPAMDPESSGIHLMP